MMRREIEIIEKKRTYATLLQEEFNWTYCEITTGCNISMASVAHICK